MIRRSEDFRLLMLNLEIGSVLGAVLGVLLSDFLGLSAGIVGGIVGALLGPEIGERFGGYLARRALNIALLILIIFSGIGLASLWVEELSEMLRPVIKDVAISMLLGILGIFGRDYLSRSAPHYLPDYSRSLLRSGILFSVAGFLAERAESTSDPVAWFLMKIIALALGISGAYWLLRIVEIIDEVKRPGSHLKLRGASDRR